MTQMIKLVDESIKITIIRQFLIFKNPEERVTMTMGDTKKTHSKSGSH